ncbi:flagellar FliJ family protein [Rhodocaloribacter sp.]
MAGKKFQFSLASVLRLRSHESNRARRRLARAIEARKVQEAKLAEAETRLTEANLTAPLTGAADPLTFRRFAAYRTHLQRVRDRERRTLTQKRMDEERARTALIERRRAEETLQTLHDEERARHIREINESEIAFLDEQALISHFRKQRSTDS